MVLIYDFDGTLTPVAYPQYGLVTACGYDAETLLFMVQDLAVKEHKDVYTAYFMILQKIAIEKKVALDATSLCMGAKDVEFNPGVFEFLEKYSHVKHYIVTSGYEDYVRQTKVMPLITDVYGTKISVVDGPYKLKS